MNGGLCKRHVLLKIVLSTLLVAACSPEPQAPGVAQARGVHLEDLDRQADPCDDAFQFSSGKWHESHPIPPSAPRWSRRWEAEENVRIQLRGILEEAARRAAAPSAGGADRLLGRFYAACMDRDLAERLGVEPLRDLLDQIETLSGAGALSAMIARFHAMDIGVPFRFHANSDMHDPASVIAQIGAAGRGRGLPGRDYYLGEEPRFRDMRIAYRDYVARLLRLAGTGPAVAAARAEAVLRMETGFARASLDNVALRRPEATDNRMSFDALKTAYPAFDWDAYHEANGLTKGDVNVAERELLKEVDRRLRTSPLADWKAYLSFHLVDSAAPFLSGDFAQANFELKGRMLHGEAEMKPRWKHCVEATDQALADALGRRYVEAHFPPEAKRRMEEMVGNVLLSMGEAIAQLSWMSDATKAQAQEKLRAITAKVGYPDRWRDLGPLQLEQDAAWVNVVATRRFNVADGWSTIGKPLDRGRWDMSPTASNAGYRALRNEIILPAGILQPPAFSMDAADAVNYGAIGSVVGHEIVHGFDDKGARFDARGVFRNWWQEADLARFRQRGQCLVEQFDQYQVEPGIPLDGRMTLGENIADLAGIGVAYHAFHLSRSGKPPAPVIDGFTPEQQFFIAWGQFRGDRERPEFARSMAQGDWHATGKYRVVGPLSNLPAYRQAFSCRDGAPMVRPPAQRCAVW